MSTSYDLSFSFNGTDKQKAGLKEYIKSLRSQLEGREEATEVAEWIKANATLEDEIWEGESFPDCAPSIWCHIDQDGAWLEQGSEDQMSDLMVLIEEGIAAGYPDIEIVGELVEYCSVSGDERKETYSSPIGSDELLEQ